MVAESRVVSRYKFTSKTAVQSVGGDVGAALYVCTCSAVGMLCSSEWVCTIEFYVFITTPCNAIPQSRIRVSPQELPLLSFFA